MSSFIRTTFRRSPKRRLRTTVMALLAVAVVGGSIAAASGVASAKSSTAPLLVWVDSTRIPAIKAYEKAHPNVRLTVVTVDGDANGDGTYQSKFALFNRVGHGWPDVYFSEENNDAATLAGPQYKDALVLSNGLVSKKVISGFAAGSMSNCTIGGQVVCLRNDLAQNVLWYNAPLMKQFGYSVPTTWKGWQAIGLDLAKNHPGYIVGTTGNSWDDDIYLWGNKCPLNELKDAHTVINNPASPNCTGIASLVDPLIADGADPAQSVFGSSFAKTYGSKIVLMVGPSWYGADLFPGLGIPAGTMAAANPLNGVTGAVGGGLWFASSHTKQPQLAASVIQWLATSPVVQTNLKISGGYPAYTSDDPAWVKASAAGGYFANDVGPAFATAAKEIWTGWSPVPWSTDAIWAANVIPALTGGSSMSSQLAGFSTQLKNNAQVNGYTVTTK